MCLDVHPIRKSCFLIIYFRLLEKRNNLKKKIVLYKE